jgi:integrase
VIVAGFVEDFICKALSASGRKPTTIANYSIIARTHLTPALFGAVTLDRLRPSDVEALLVTQPRAAPPAAARSRAELYAAIVHWPDRGGAIGL